MFVHWHGRVVYLIYMSTIIKCSNFCEMNQVIFELLPTLVTVTERVIMQPLVFLTSCATCRSIYWVHCSSGCTLHVTSSLKFEEV